MNYARGIAEARARTGLSKRKLASLAGFAPSYITHLEAGKKVPSLAAVESIASALGIPVYLLMLLASDDGDLRGITSQEAATLGEHLLTLLRAGISEPAGEAEAADDDES